MYSILIADNESVIREGLAGMISRLDLPLAVKWSACDGAEAVRMIEESLPDIIITDIRMPEMDGLSLCAYVHEHYPDIQLILLTGFPDFAYARQAIQYDVSDFILKPTDSGHLRSALEKACMRLQQKSGARMQSLHLRQVIFLQELLYRNKHSALYVLNQMDELMLDMTDYCILSATVLPAPGDEMPELISDAQKILGEVLEPVRHYFIPKSDDSFYVLVLKGSDEELLAACKKAAEVCAFSKNYDLAVGISSRFLDPLLLQTAAREADDACLFTASERQSGTERYGNLPKLSRKAVPQIISTLRDVKSALEEGNEKSLSHCLKAFFAEMRSQRLPFSGMLGTCMLLSHYCETLLADHLVPDEQLPSLSGGLSATAPDMLEMQLTQQVMDTFRKLHAAEKNTSDLIGQVRKYVDLHYEEPLSLDLLAEEVHLSPGYLSRQFKKEAGCTLSAYILSVRMEHACLLLRTTERRTYEIAEMVGIPDPVYFSRLFKKTYGVRPSEFRGA